MHCPGVCCQQSCTCSHRASAHPFAVACLGSAQVEMLSGNFHTITQNAVPGMVQVEIKRILEEYTEKAMRRDAAPSTGRYSVV